jgi:hypothetical protein
MRPTTTQHTIWSNTQRPYAPTRSLNLQPLLLLLLGCALPPAHGIPQFVVPGGATIYRFFVDETVDFLAEVEVEVVSGNVDNDASNDLTFELSGTDRNVSVCAHPHISVTV